MNIVDICRRNDKGVSETAFLSQPWSAGVRSEHAGGPEAISDFVSQNLTKLNTKAKCVSSTSSDRPKHRIFPIRRVCQQHAEHGGGHQNNGHCTSARADAATAARGASAGRVISRDGRDSPERDVKPPQPCKSFKPTVKYWRVWCGINMAGPTIAV